MNRIIIPTDMDQKIKTAIQSFWSTRENQISRQTESEIHDLGNRGAVTGGKQLDGF